MLELQLKKPSIHCIFRSGQGHNICFIAALIFRRVLGMCAPFRNQTRLAVELSEMVKSLLHFKTSKLALLSKKFLCVIAIGEMGIGVLVWPNLKPRLPVASNTLCRWVIWKNSEHKYPIDALSLSTLVLDTFVGYIAN